MAFSEEELSYIRSQRLARLATVAPDVALVIDDLVSVNPWRPRFLRIYGTADFVERDGYAGHQAYLRIKPEKSWSFGSLSQS
jgi:pyridoxamine 5'-phosphate oxidase family protein